MELYRWYILKYGAYALIAVLLFRLQSIPALLEIGGIRPLPVAALAIVVAIMERELSGVLFGIFCGYLCDLYTVAPMGFYMLFLTALGLLAARYWGEPAAALRLIGITGTNGKTTTAHLLHHLLQSAGIKTGRIGTDGICWGEHRLPNPYTTPPPTLLHRVLHQMAEDGVTTVVMEVSSQALAQQRTVGLVFEAAVFTNLSPEHLDYHSDMERYFAEKEKLFSQCRRAVR